MLPSSLLAYCLPIIYSRLAAAAPAPIDLPLTPKLPGFEVESETFEFEVDLTPPQQSPAGPEFQVGQVIPTTNGPVQGHPATKVPAVSEYLGLKYAQPPTGMLRFEPPVPVNRSDDIFHAAIQPAWCPSYEPGSEEIWDYVRKGDLKRRGQDDQPVYEGPMEVDEDCLSLSIWTRPQFGEEKKAVLVFLHDGGVRFGTTVDPFVEGPHLADQEDMVVVSINYRLGIFGFPGIPKMDQNPGFRDQRLAIQWVRNNILSFGGDPSRITLFGQSAGGASLDYYSFAHRNNDPIVNGFIQESGTALSFGPVTPEQATLTWYAATMKLGCGSITSSQATLLACMRMVSADTILSAISGRPGHESILSPLKFSPVIDNEFVFGNLEERAAAGDLIKRPLLIGTTDDDAGLTRPFVEASGDELPDPVEKYITAALFDCAIKQRAELSAKAGVKTWRYRLFGQLAPAEFSYSLKPKLFGDSNIPEDVTPEMRKEAANGRYIRTAWANFAKDPENGLMGGEYGWPVYAAEGAGVAKLQQLQVEGRRGANTVEAAKWDARCQGIQVPGNLMGVVQAVDTVLRGAITERKK